MQSIVHWDSVNNNKNTGKQVKGNKQHRRSQTGQLAVVISHLGRPPLKLPLQQLQFQQPSLGASKLHLARSLSPLQLFCSSLQLKSTRNNAHSALYLSSSPLPPFSQLAAFYFYTFISLLVNSLQLVCSAPLLYFDFIPRFVLISSVGGGSLLRLYISTRSTPPLHLYL